MERFTPPAVAMVEQTLRLEFASVPSATAARIAVAPVYDNKEWACSGRWDDNQANSLNMHAALSRHGLKSNYYLTATDPAGRFGQAFGQQLLQNGHGIGGHSMTHPHFPELPPHEVFWEVLANRMAREAELDVPLNSFAFPYGQYRAVDDPAVWETTSHSLGRAGYHHCVYADFVRQNPHVLPGTFSTVVQVVPGDREVDLDGFRATIAAILAAPGDHQALSHCLSLGVHAWQEGEQWARLEILFEELAQHDWWFCSLTDYAAYARQASLCRLEPLPSSDDRVLAYRLRRPTPAACGARWPLTLTVKDGELAGASLDGLAVDTDVLHVNLPYPGHLTLPQKIGLINNPQNRPEVTAADQDPDFPGLLALLAVDATAGRIALTLANRTKDEIRPDAVTLRLPLCYATGLVTLAATPVAPGQTARWEQPLPAQQPAADGVTPSQFYAAELDFAWGGATHRLFTTTTIA